MRPLMPPVQTPDNLFHDGNPLTGELGTIVDAEHLNNEQAAIRDTQSELIAILTAAEMEPESTAGQLLAALNKLYAPLNDTLGALSTLVGGANKLPYFTASNAAALTALSGIGRDIIGKATVADVLTYLGLGDVAKAGVAGGLLASDGYITLPLIIGGVKTNVILQWVTGPTAGAETVNYPNVTFPVTFPNACLFAAPFTVGNNTTSADQIFQAVSWTTSTAKVFPQWFGSGSQGLVHPIILAIGW
ncbi:gp53-like domain-containing protein [Enterobacter roggenkampii]|uniref:gp53-like domain-containing protein n=2 Tax=Enterobacter roggenkampii TaxID=1812935 RepID=UPI003BD422CC